MQQGIDVFVLIGVYCVGNLVRVSIISEVELMGMGNKSELEWKQE